MVGDRGADISSLMRREIAEHGWEVVSSNASPYIAWGNPDCLASPLSERDVLLGTACAEALIVKCHRRGNGKRMCDCHRASERL